MFRHQGKSRTIKHNLQIATILSFIAGIVNVTGYLEFKRMTTNVTGHFALFMNDVAKFEVWKGTTYFFYFFSFLIGSFTSSFLIEKFKENERLNIFVLPTIIECLILVFIPIVYETKQITNADLIVCCLLFAMGLQNSFVTKISNTVVRTTHLTGLVTDLGIELSQLFFTKGHPHQKEIRATIKLRIYIIIFFFLGGFIGGILYSRLKFGLNTLFLGAIVLISGLFFDDLKFRMIMAKRKSKQRKINTK